MKQLIAPIFVIVVIALVAWACTIGSQEQACRHAAREESALTACAGSGSCLSKPEDWQRFQADVRECMGRIK
jgi:hypothetical protein